MADAFQIEPASVSDAPEILALQRLAFQSEAEIYGPEIQPLRETLDELLSEFEGGVVLKALSPDAGIVASVRGSMDATGTCHVNKLMTHPAFRRRGLASALMRALESRFHDAKRFEIFTGDRSESAMKLYRSLGYREFICKTSEDIGGPTLVYLERVV